MRGGLSCACRLLFSFQNGQQHVDVFRGADLIARRQYLRIPEHVADPLTGNKRFLCSNSAEFVTLKARMVYRIRIVFPLLLLLALLAPASFGRRNNTVSSGTWGGLHMGIQVQPNKANIEFDCARGSIEQPIPLDSQGRFDVAGIYIQEHGGPVSLGEPPDSHPARYTGQVRGRTMSVTVTLTDKMETIGQFNLRHGQSPFVFKCL
jgi:hypothetical protein